MTVDSRVYSLVTLRKNYTILLNETINLLKSMGVLSSLFDVTRDNKLFDNTANQADGVAFWFLQKDYFRAGFLRYKRIVEKKFGSNRSVLKNKLNSIMSNLVTLVHVGGGLPMRVTELLINCALLNQGARMRNVYISYGRICILQTYTKTMNYSQSERLMIKYLPLLVSNILIAVTCFVTPVVCEVY